MKMAFAILGLLMPSLSHGMIHGITGPEFSLTAEAAQISTGDGHSLRTWGFAANGQMMQYPGPTLIVNQGDTVTVHLTNQLPEPVSILFPGQTGVVATGGSPGLITREAPSSGGTVTYTFVASRPGTFLYQSGTHQELQIEMGLFGALIVRPLAPNQAYDHPDSAFDREYLYVLSEMDYKVHDRVEQGRASEVDNNAWWPTLWFINGRNAPDTMAMDHVEWLPHQPYSAMAQMHPGEKVLLRIINAGRDLHPFHTHGNHALVIARDGRMLESSPGAGPDLAAGEFTVQTVPGETYDAIFEWTGKDLGWDVYGHAAGDPLEPNEYAPDHGKPFPVILPEQQNLTFGGTYSGSPFLGALGALPPGEGGLNLNGGLFFMWHSHNEKEMVNDDIFPGGMMTMMIIEPPSVSIP